MIRVGRVLGTAVAAALISGAPVALAQAPSFDFGSSSFERHGSGVAKGVMTNAAANADAINAEVESAMREMQPKEGATGKMASDKKWNHWRGADRSEVSEANKEHTGNAIAVFENCQQDDYDHTYLFMYFIPPIPVESGCLDYKRYIGWAEGLIIRCDVDWWCGCECEMRDVVEYFAPVEKVNVSKQILQTGVIDKNKLRSVPKALEEIDKTVPKMMEANFDLLVRKTGNYGVDATRRLNEARGSIKSNAQQGYDLGKQFTGSNPDLLNVASDAQMYSRVVAEGINSWTFYVAHWFPHVYKTPYFGTDLPMGYSYSRILQLSSKWSRQWNGFLSPGGEFTCIRNNISTGHTPRFSSRRSALDPYNWVFTPQRDRFNLCLNDIGERYPMTASNLRPIKSDSVWAAGLAKGVDIHQKVGGTFLANINIGGFGFGPYVYDEDVDKWHVASNGDFRQETPQCDVLDELTRPNVAYKKANIDKPFTGMEETIEGFRRLKGAWGEKGKSREWYDNGSCFSFFWEWGPTEFDDEFRLG